MYRKICPLLFACPDTDASCAEDRCAWWDEDSTTCYLCTIAEALAEISVDMEERKER